jgi:hypothetical protein
MHPQTRDELNQLHGKVQDLEAEITNAAAQALDNEKDLTTFKLEVMAKLEEMSKKIDQIHKIVHYGR